MVVFSFLFGAACAAIGAKAGPVVSFTAALAEVMFRYTRYVMYLAPLDSPVEAEVRIATRDVGFIRAGDPVKVKFDTFNFIEHGMAEGYLRWISEGAFTSDDNGTATPEPYYKARIALTKVDLRNVPEGFRLIPGMTLSGDIHIGTRSILMYIVSGALQGMGEAMREP